MIVSGYSLDLYCNTCGERGQYCSDLKNCYHQVRKDAKMDGWKLEEADNLAYCPRCSGTKPKKREDHFAGYKLVKLQDIQKMHQKQ